MVKYPLLLVFVGLTFLGISCRKSPVAPPQPTSCEFPPGNRNFTWRVDTVAWWPSEVGGVWAFSDTDAYVMGNISGPTIPGQKHYPGLHWNGQLWDTTLSWTGLFQDNPRIFANGVIGDDRFMVAAGYWVLNSEKAAIEEFNNDTKKWTPYRFQTAGSLYSVWTDGNGYFIAVGDNGMVYTKDGYDATWIYSRAPTDFSFNHITGISKTEMYASAVLSLSTGQDYEQYWKYDGTQWYKLFDNQDTTGNIVKLPGDYSFMLDVAAYRCPVTDSLQLYLTGWDSFLLQSRGQSLNYSAVNLSTLGLPLHAQGNSASIIDLFSPNDIWFLSSEYNFYQWNGSDFQQVYISGLPAPEQFTGFIRNMIKTKSGRVFLPCEVSPQVYVVAQGTP